MFVDRAQGGRSLAEALRHLPHGALVLGIPRGGVIVARALADTVGAELDVILARKLGAPYNPELAIGALGPDGVPVLDEDVIAMLGGVPAAHIERVVERERAEVVRRMRLYRGDRPPLQARGRTCVVVDDGIATGSTARACLRWLRAQDAERTVLAVPVAPPQALPDMRGEADEVVCLLTPPRFLAVGQWYERFDEISDDEVCEALSVRAGRDAASGPAWE